MSRLEPLIRWVDAKLLLAVASACTALGLVFMVLPSFLGAPIFVIAGMTFGHVFGLTGVVLFAASVLREVLTQTSVDVTAHETKAAADLEHASSKGEPGPEPPPKVD